MSKKNDGRRKGRPALRLVPKVADATSAQEPVLELLRLDEVVAIAKVLIDGKQWHELEQLGRTPLARIRDEDRSRAERTLMRYLVLGLNEQLLLDSKAAGARVQGELDDAVGALAKLEDHLHDNPYFFDVYLRRMGWSKAALLDAFNRLVRACRSRVDMDWLVALRQRGLRLLEWRHREIEESDPDIAPLGDLPDVLTLLEEAFVKAEADVSIVDGNRTILGIFRHDLHLRSLDSCPWDYRNAAPGFIRLPTPPERAETDEEREYATDEGERFSPRSWAFLWELEHTSADGLPALRQRYTQPLGHDTVEGLRQILFAVTGPSADVEAHMVRGIRHLESDFDRGEFLFGSLLTIAFEGGAVQIDLSPGMRVAEPEDLLVRLLENAPAEFTRVAELHCLCDVYRCVRAFTDIDDDLTESRWGTAALRWLFDQCLGLQFLFASRSTGASQSLPLFLDCVRRSAESGEDLRGSYDNHKLTTAELTAEDGAVAVNLLRRLAAVRGSLPSHSESIWLASIGAIFAALAKDKVAARQDLLVVARQFSADLLKANQAFRLAFLEQVAGDARAAMRHYLTDLESQDNPGGVSVANSKLLWDRSDDATVVRGLVEVLEQGLAVSRHADVVRALLAHAQAKLKVVEHQEQFEKTAVERWPSLTAPARKILSVLASIQKYSSMEELAQYAGMEVAWVRRHYDRLHQLGMVLRSGGSYRINSHIAPLLERESQHGVIGRIVRSQGTSGVKQVFNSQREFDIYQILLQLCPNHLVFPNCALQSIMAYERMKELVSADDFGYYLRASVDIVVVSSTTFLPMLAIEVDSVFHDVERQKINDEKKDRLFAAAGIAFMRLRPVGSPSADTIRAQVSEHVDALVRTLRADLPGYDQARGLLVDLASVKA